MRKILNRLFVAISSLVGIMLISQAVLAAVITVSISPLGGPPGTIVTVTAVNSSFTIGETVTIVFDTQTVLSATANATGGLSATITVPAAASGTHTIGATGVSSLNTGNVTFTVTPGMSANRLSGPVGTSVVIGGSGFAASETGISVTFDGTSVATGVSADSRGSWSATIIIPAAASGTNHTIDAYGTTLSSAVPDLTFIVTPSISSNKASAAPGATVTVTGSGFGINETGISVTYDGSAVATSPASITANAKGSWTATFTVPSSPPGAHTIDASGSATSAGVVSDITFTTSAGISVNKAGAAPGTSVTITGAGFTASETGISVTYDDKTVATGITANAQGSWAATFTVPASPAGSHVIDASGSATTAGSISDLIFTTTAGITVNKAGAAPGGSVTVTGAGFGAGEAGISVTYDDKTVASGITANIQGGWTAAFTVPASPAGPHTIDAGGTVTQAPSVTEVIFNVIPGMTSNRPTAAPGTSVTITGAGFSAGETGISVTYDDKTVASGITANTQGGWTATFVVPASTSGTHSIKAQGSVTQLISLSETGFSIGSGVLLNPVTGAVGANVDISGSGFASNSPLKILYDNKEIPATGAVTDEAGSFSTSFVLPKSKAGIHTIKITDSQGNDSAAAFTVENTPPPAPAPVSPADGERVGLTGDVTPTLKWSVVADPSGVSFTIQIDTDPDFSHPILEKTDLTGSRYILTASEALPRGQYYWRVRAIDGASNESAWSQTYQLKSGLMPLSTLILIIILLIAAAAGLVYFFVIRRLRMRTAGAMPEAEPSRVVPGQWRLIEPPQAAASEGKTPWRLALPQPAKGSKQLSTEEMARLKVIMDFAQSLPLVEPGYTSKWLLDLAQSNMSIEPSVDNYRKLLEGELQVKYEPAWLRHPIFQDLAALLEGQPILDDLNSFVDAVNRCTSEATLLLQKIYGEATAEVPNGILERDGWEFISAVYLDAMRWYLGKSLHDPSERDYVIKSGGGPDENAGSMYLWGEESSAFGEPLIRVADEKEAARFRLLHLKLRRTYRNSDVAKQLIDMMTQLAVQRDRLSGAFGQFDTLTRN